MPLVRWNCCLIRPFGYVDKRLNRGCLVQLPDSTGAIRWHYRTRDLVCLSDGSLEYRGCADG